MRTSVRSGEGKAAVAAANTVAVVESLSGRNGPARATLTLITDTANRRTLGPLLPCVKLIGDVTRNARSTNRQERLLGEV